MGHGNGMHSGNRAHALEHAAIEVLGLRRFPYRGRQIEGQEVSRIVTGIGGEALNKTAHGKPRAGKQYERQRDLGHHKRLAHQTAIGSRSRTRASFLQVVRKIHAGDPRSGNQAKKNACNERNTERKEQHRKINLDFFKPRHIAWTKNTERLQSEMASEQTEGASEKTKQHAFGYVLAHQPARTGAEGAAHSNFTATSHALSQEQVADVRASDKKNEADRCEHDQKRLANPMANPGEHGDYDGALLGVVRGVLLFEGAGDGVHFALRLAQGYARFDSTDHRHEIFTAQSCLKIQRNENLRVPHHDVAKIVGQYAYNCERLVVDGKCPADPSRVTAEALLPE